MSMISSTSEIPALQDYVQPVVASLGSSKTNERKKFYPCCLLSCFLMFRINIFYILSWKFRHRTKTLYY